MRSQWCEGELQFAKTIAFLTGCDRRTALKALRRGPVYRRSVGRRVRALLARLDIRDFVIHGAIYCPSKPDQKRCETDVSGPLVFGGIPVAFLSVCPTCDLPKETSDNVIVIVKRSFVRGHCGNVFYHGEGDRILINVDDADTLAEVGVVGPCERQKTQRPTTSPRTAKLIKRAYQLVEQHQLPFEEAQVQAAKELDFPVTLSLSENRDGAQLLRLVKTGR